MNVNERSTILIADDSELNRMILRDMLEDEYNIVEAEDGVQALDILKNNDKYDIDLVLLDIFMPNKNGFEVLRELDRKWWKVDIPVIVISAENDRSFVVETYKLGAVDVIHRPFDSVIVQHRVNGVMRMHRQEKWFSHVATTQIMDKYKQNNMMIQILSSIVEFRNGESGRHVINVQMLTDMLLRELLNITDKYKFSKEELSRISIAAALHDVGKIAIPSEILNKPGRFTDEEFKIMKTHSQIGSDMLSAIKQNVDNPLIDTAVKICRWHHERYNGKGYPDGIEADNIPIEAQVVAVADVYDALTSERCYKKAFSHEKALEMITAGECGAFNPLLMVALQNISEEIRERLSMETPDSIYQEEMQKIIEETLRPSRMVHA